MNNKWTKARLEILDDQIVEVLRQDRPQSIRHIFYRMTDPRLAQPVPKTEAGYRRVQGRTKKLREDGRIGWDWIVDLSRVTYPAYSYQSAADFVTAYLTLYRFDVWAQNGQYAEVWTESRSLAAVVQDTCQTYRVGLFPAGGFASLTMINDAANRIAAQLESGAVRGAHIAYVGDYDPSGLEIDRSLEETLRDHIGDLSDFLTFDRLAVTERQIVDWQLPTKPRKPTELRRTDIQDTVEAEAIPAGQMRSLLADRIASYLPTDAIENAEAREKDEIAAILYKIKNGQVAP